MKQLIPAFAGIPTIYWSSPGQGKSSAIESIARKLGYHCETLVLSQRDPSDVGGIPFIKNGRTVFLSIAINSEHLLIIVLFAILEKGLFKSSISLICIMVLICLGNTNSIGHKVIEFK